MSLIRLCSGDGTSERLTIRGQTPSETDAALLCSKEIAVLQNMVDKVKKIPIPEGTLEDINSIKEKSNEDQMERQPSLEEQELALDLSVAHAVQNNIAVYLPHECSKRLFNRSALKERLPLPAGVLFPP